MAVGKRKERDLFSVKAPVDGNKTSKKRKKQKQGKEGGNVQKKNKIDHDSFAAEIQPLTYETVIAWQGILGCVQEVRDYVLVVSLPHKLSGIVSIAQISNAYTALLKKVKEEEEEADVAAEIHTLKELFSPGQYVVTRVISVENLNGNFKVNLTLLPQEVNFGLSSFNLQVGYVLPCAVSSVEDNGFVMDTGIPNVRGAFLKNTAIEGSGIVGIGSVVRCIISKILHSDETDSMQLILSADSKAVYRATVDVADAMNLSLLLPGTAVSTSISKVQREGLYLMMADFDGVVSCLHLKRPFDQLSQYKISQKVRARVLYVMPLTKVVHFTLQETVCAASVDNDPLHGFKIGDRIEDAEIYEAKHSGVYFKIGENCRGFCSSNRLTNRDQPPKHITRDFPVGSKRMCRLLKFNYMDQLFIVALRKSVLEQQILGYGEVQAGNILDAIIKGYSKHGAEVAVSKFVDGHIPFPHLTDSSMKHPQRKFNVGDTVRARVLKVNPQGQHLLLTCKKHLVESKEPIVTEYTKDIEGVLTEGCIVKVYHSGLLISFYNDVKGFVSKSYVSTEPVDNLEKVFTEGQVVKCRIVSVNPEKKNIVLSLIIHGTTPFGKKNKEAKLMSEIRVRDKVVCIVKEIREDIIRVRIKTNDCEAEIPVYHLSDDIDNSRLIKELLCEGDEIHNAVVFRKNVTTITLTLKYSVYHWVSCVSDDALLDSKFLEHESFPASVTEIRTYGLFVSIPVGDQGFKAFVHVKNLTDSVNWFQCTDLEIYIGQSLSVVYKGKDEKDRRIFSSAHKDNLRNTTQSSIQLLHSYFRDEDIIRNGLMKHIGKKTCLAKFDVGVKLKGRVKVVTPIGIIVTVEDKVTGILSPDHQDVHAKVEIGQEITTCVLHVNIKEECLELTARPDLLKSLHTKENSKLKVGMKVKCEVLLVKKKFIMVVLKTRCVGMVAYMPSRRHTNDLSGLYGLYTVGQEYQMVIKYIEGTLVLGILKQHDRGEDLNIVHEHPVIVFEKSIDTPTEEENMKADTCSGEENFLEKIQRVRADSQSSLNSLEGTTVTNAEGDGKNKGKLKNLMSDSIPQIDEEKLAVIQRRRKLEREEIRFLEQQKKKIEAANKHVEDVVNTDTVKRIAPEGQQRLEAVYDSAVEAPDAVKEVEEPKKNSKKQPKISKKKQQEMYVDEGNQMEAVDSGVDENVNSDDDKLKTSRRLKSCLKLGTGFVWEVPDTVENVEKDSSESEEEETSAKKKKVKKLSKSEREALAKEEEQHLHELELARLEKDRLPQSALDYEELLQHSPNSSAVWIQFISFHLESAEVDKAKAVAYRALEVIDIREEEERLNVWTVLLRLEVLYGTSESVSQAYQEALSTNDQLKIQLALAMVYSESNKLKEAEKIYFTMTKKFGKVRDVWIKAGIFFYTQNKADEARHYMDRALLSLDKKEHVELVSQFGQLEFRFGEAERGRTMFESLLSNFPKRINIWSVYVDLLTKRGDIEGARHVLDRMTGLKLRLRKMRSVFKKFLNFEKEHGTPQSVETVKKRVQEFVASTLHKDG